MGKGVGGRGKRKEGGGGDLEGERGIKRERGERIGKLRITNIYMHELEY